MSDIRNVLYENEKILWEGKPERGPYIAGACLMSIPLFFFGAFFAAMPLFMAISAIHSGQKYIGYMVFLMPHFWVGLAIMFGPSISGFLSYSRTAYAITDKRALIESGIFSHNIRSIGYDQISNATVRVSAVDDWYKLDTGTIILSTAGMFLANGTSRSLSTAFSHIKNPYEVFKFFEKTELDVKTDMQYPNAMRPAENPGYNTTYDSKNPPGN